MKIKWSGLGMTDGSGKIGGNVAAKNRAGNYLRRKGQVLNPQTIAQILVRGIFASFSQLWRTITQAQRDGWNALAATVSLTDQFGDSYNPTGFNYFKSANQNGDTVGQGPYIDAPTLESGPDAVTITDTGATLEVTAATLDNLDFSVSNPATNSGPLIPVVEATPPVSLGRNEGSVKNLFRIIGTIPAGIAAGATGTYVGADAVMDALYADYVAKFGAPAPDQKVFFRVFTVNSNTGQKTLVIAWSALTVA